MGTNTLTNRSAGQTILDTFFNDIHQAIGGDFVGRNTSGVPAVSQNLGTTALPWGTINASSLVLGGESVDTSQITSPVNRIVSGKTRTTSNQPAFITPTGSAASFTLFGSTTNLILDINGASVAVSTDIAVTGLTVGPSATHTCLVNDAAAAGQMATRTWGENGQRKLTVDTMGATMSAQVGKFCAFKTGTEYFLGFIDSATQISKCFRGFFYNSSLAPLNRVALTDNDVITLMSLGWVFVENNGTTVSVTYTNPVWDYTAPTSPVTNDYWYDQANQVWKRYDGASWAIINRTHVGFVVVDSANCVAARCVDFYYNYQPLNTVRPEFSTTSISRIGLTGSAVSVRGRTFRFNEWLGTWNMTTQLAIAADMYSSTEQASTFYYLYIADTGQFIISDIQPYQRADFFGAYHPHNPWRCVGIAFNDGSSNITSVIPAVDYQAPITQRSSVIVYGGATSGTTGNGSTNTYCRRFLSTDTNVGTAITYADSATLGATFTINESGMYALFYCDQASGATTQLIITKNSTTLTSGAIAFSISSTADAPTGAIATATAPCVYLEAGDVIRAQDATSNARGALATRFIMFSITKLSN